MFNVKTFARLNHQHNVKVGWWNKPNIYQKLQLVSTEVAEATEGERKKGKMDDHLKNRLMGEVELADALIRILDVGEYYNLDLDLDINEAKVEWYDLDIVARHLTINRYIIKLADLVVNSDQGNNNFGEGVNKTGADLVYSLLVKSIFLTSECMGYDIYGAMKEKAIYNKTRKDHSIANRQSKNGKQF